MLFKLNKTYLSILICIVMMLATYLGYTFTNDSFIASIIWPASGFAVGFYYIYEKKAISGIVIGLFLANFSFRHFLYDEVILINLFLSAVFTFSNFFQAYIFKTIFTKKNDLSIFSVRNIFIIFVASVSAAIIGALFSVSILSIVYSQTDYLLTASQWALGDFTGIVIFGSAMLFSNSRDSKFFVSRKNSILSVLYLLFFSLFCVVLFSEVIPEFTVNRFSFLFMIFFFMIPFYFSFRMIVIIDSIYVLMFQIFISQSVGSNELGITIFSLNMFLLVLSSIAITTKMVLNSVEENNMLLRESNSKFENLLESTNILFKLSDELLGEGTEIDESYLSEMFKIAASIFDCFDYASCYIKTEDHVNYVAAHGYDVDVLNDFFDDLEEFEWDFDVPRIITNAGQQVETQLEDKYRKFNKIYPRLTESIRFNIFIDDGVVGGMSFDNVEGSNKSFSFYDLDGFKSYQKLMNSFYQANSLYSKNNNLKNDIVLSLVRTLELYDHYTGGHSEDVASLSGKIASMMNLSEQERYNVYWAGIVHDIGKVGIPSDIINKPEKLTLEEYDQIKDHPVFGFQILSKSEDLNDIALLVKHHHEWWNGEGYPDGLKENKIPLGSQILGVCDAVSSMATKRPYTLVKSSREILTELKLYLGTQFGPRPTEAMIEFIEEGFLDEFYKDK